MKKLIELLNEYEESKKSDKLIGQEYYFVEEIRTIQRSYRMIRSYN